MAIKADRQVDSWELGYYLNETASPGVIVVVSTATSGNDLDGTAALATVSANSSGTQPIGMLMSEFVSIDQTRVSRNPYKDQQVVGEKAAIMTKGWAVTNKVVSATAGCFAALASSGSVVAVAEATVNTHNALLQPIVGRFRSGVDEDGYARVYVDL